MKRPIIGVVARPYITDNNRQALCILENVRRNILRAGGIPHIILPTKDIVYINNKESELTDEDKEILDTQINMCDGILMPGGDRIYFYDKYICSKVNEIDMPLLGICMGMQVMCNYNNENVNIKIEGHKEPDSEYVHDVKILKDSKLYEIVNEENIKVNSLHGYMVPNAGDYTIAAQSNNVIEAIEKKDKLFNIGVQWHPERTNDEPSEKIINSFVNACKIYMINK
jgi:putative glutamine amidotransferase